MATDPLQTLEVFHLTFLRALARSLPVSSFVLKGGCNLRFFFGSIRYSQDMDLDAGDIAVHLLRDKVMAILRSSRLADALRTFGIERAQPPDISHAKQTETVQRFKVHLLTTAGEDLATKVEFSRRGLDSPIRSEPVHSAVLAGYRMAPLLVPHYTAEAAVRQKIRALVSRRQPEARDVFDLYTLSSLQEATGADPLEGFTPAELRQAREIVFAISYPQYRDTVVSFLAAEDRPAHDSEQTWDEIRLRAVSLLEVSTRDEA